MDDAAITIDESLSIALAHYSVGDLQIVFELCKEILAKDANQADAHYLLGMSLWKSARREEAAKELSEVLRLKPAHLEARFNLGSLLEEMGFAEEALMQFRNCLNADSEFFLAQLKVANLLEKAGDLLEALAAYDKAKQINAELQFVHNRIAVLSMMLGRFEQAIASIRFAIDLDNTQFEPYYLLAEALRLSADVSNAVAAAQRVIEMNPNFAEAHKCLGDCFFSLYKHQDAIAAYKQALVLNQNYYEAHVCLATAMALVNDTKGAKEHFKKAAELNADRLLPRWGGCMANLALSYKDEIEIQTARAEYEKDLIELDDSLKLESSHEIAEAVAVLGTIQPFYLSAQAQNDRELQSKYGQMVCRIMAARYPQWAQPRPKKTGIEDKKIKVGFLSAFFREHSNWKILLRGFAECLQNEDFQVYAYATGSIKDDITAEARVYYDKFFESQDLETLAKEILEDDLDLLIYPELGMDALTLRLAALRLAPVQCVSWGHPQSSGLPSIDYFLSSDLMEPESGQAAYTEELVRLPNLSIFYTPLNQAADDSRFEEYGVDATKLNYLCLQALHKYLPQHDQVYAEIARRVPDSRFLFIADADGSGRILKERLQRVFAAADLNWQDYVRFLPLIKNEEFCALCDCSDIFLDCMEWSGCTTTLEAIERNCVPVTMSGRFMRGRHTSAILQMMNIHDTIASSREEFVEIAVRLGLDQSWRTMLKEEIASKKKLLYRDPVLAQGLCDFLRKICRSKT